METVTYSDLALWNEQTGEWFEMDDFRTADEAIAAIADRPGRWQVRTVTTQEIVIPEA